VRVGGGRPQAHSAFARSAERSLEQEQMVTLNGTSTRIGCSGGLNAPARADAMPFQIRAIAPVLRPVDRHT
jgi:hypothetical protein